MNPKRRAQKGYTFVEVLVASALLGIINDTAWFGSAWFGSMLGWVFLSLQMVATAIVALGDARAEPLIPHGLSKASLVGALPLVCAGGAGVLSEWAIRPSRLGRVLHADGDLGSVAERACLVHAARPVARARFKRHPSKEPRT